MVQIIAGEKGKGKTKIIINKVNEEVKTSKGSVVFLDKNNKHMYDLNNKIRLINAQDYKIKSLHEFNGFLCGIISQDHDLEKVYIDSFFIVACITADDLELELEILQKLSELYQVDFVISISLNSHQIKEEFKENIIAAL